MTAVNEQLEFEAPAPQQFGLVVDEPLLHAIACPAADWWAMYAGRYARSGRERVLDICMTGAVAEYGPFTQDDAEFLRGHMVEKGVHPKALKLRKWLDPLPDCSGFGRCIRCARTHKERIAPEAVTS